MARLKRVIEEVAKHPMDRVIEHGGVFFPDGQYYVDDAITDPYYTDDAKVNNYSTQDA